ncbi:hypothetical protein [Streptosporangium sp. NPDC002524]|uniref:hypothetical protein n=1 Tax=Streptosporangium sp. NPDC002524 TaxID=3154537 RepID=UPI003332D031
MRIISKNYKVPLSKATLSALLTGKGRVGPPRWDKVVSFLLALKESLKNDGMDPDAVLGSMDSWRERYLACLATDAAATPVAAQEDTPAAPVRVPVPPSPTSDHSGQQSGTVPTDQAPSLPTHPFLTPPAPQSPSSPPVHGETRPASVASSYADLIQPRYPQYSTPTPSPSGGSLGDPFAWPHTEPAFPPSPDLYDYPIEDPYTGLLRPSYIQQDVDTWRVSPESWSITSARQSPEDRQLSLWQAVFGEDPAQPVEKEATYAVLSRIPNGHESASRMAKSFGHRGVELLDGAEAGNALYAFELAILLINSGSVHEGGEFLRMAARLDSKLTVDFEPFRTGDRLYGKIVKDVFARVGTAYENAGYPVRAAEWAFRAGLFTGSDPIAMRIAHHARHVRTPDRHAPFDPVQVQQIESLYWRAYAFDPDDTRFTSQDVSMLRARLAAEDAKAISPLPTGRHRAVTSASASATTSHPAANGTASPGDQLKNVPTNTQPSTDSSPYRRFPRFPPKEFTRSTQ